MLYLESPPCGSVVAGVRFKVPRLMALPRKMEMKFGVLGGPKTRLPHPLHFSRNMGQLGNFQDVCMYLYKVISAFNAPFMMKSTGVTPEQEARMRNKTSMHVKWICGCQALPLLPDCKRAAMSGVLAHWYSVRPFV